MANATVGMHGAMLNLTNDNESANCSRDNVLKTVVFPVLYAVTFILGLLLNSLAAWIFLSIPTTSHFVLYLKNVVVADLLMTFTFPFKILSDSNMAPLLLRVFVCRFSSVIFYLTMYISILFFGLISIDRCRKTLQPFTRTTPKALSRRKLLSCLIWVGLLSLSLPNSFLTNNKPVSPYFKCSDLKSELGLRWHEAVNHVCQVIFWANLATVVVCYGLISRELYASYARTQTSQGGGSTQPKKKKVRAKIFLVIGVFFVCFVPFHFARVPYTMSQTRSLFTCQMKIFLFQLKETTLWMCSLNAVLDPLIYFFLCRSFRTSLYRTLHLSTGPHHPNTASTLQEIPVSHP